MAANVYRASYQLPTLSVMLAVQCHWNPNGPNAMWEQGERAVPVPLAQNGRNFRNAYGQQPSGVVIAVTACQSVELFN